MKRKFLSLFLAFAMLMAVVPALHTTDVEAAASISIGDYVEMGTYYGEPILWRCVDIDENGPLMLSDKIICLKAFDAETSSKSLIGSHIRRDSNVYYASNISNYWADSNMRSWLNSSESSGNVTWLCGNPPINSEVYYNAYDQEAGFLTNFTQGELNTIKTVRQKSIVAYPEYENGVYTSGTVQHTYNSKIEDVVQNYDSAYSEQVTDTMFLLDVKQVYAVYNNSDILGEYYYIGKPTDTCIANNNCPSVDVSIVENLSYWLRTPSVDSKNFVRVVDISKNVSGCSADIGYVGVRPAFYIDLVTSKFESGSGTAISPYTISSVAVSNTDTVSNDNISVLLNGTELSFDQPPMMINDRTMVPIRAIFEAMGYIVSWNDDTQTATATKGTDKIVVQIGNSTISYVTDGKSGTYKCDTVPQIVNDRTLVPVRAIAESAGCTVDWNDDTQTVIIIK